MTVSDDRVELSQARSHGPTLQSIMEADLIEAPSALRVHHDSFLGSEGISTDRYTSQEWHDREVEYLWGRCWQMACRVEDIPEVGDSIVYDIADDSLIVVRTAPDDIRAFHNVCLHRGTTLVAEKGRFNSFRCPFHGFTWNIDGSFRTMPCEWDFPHVNKEDFGLPTAHVDVWGGWVFVNMAEDPMPFAEYVERLPEHFVWDHARYVKQAHVSQVLDCNWKVAMEAFLESYHVIATHPQLMMLLGDANTQYDVVEGERRWNRMITAQGVRSPHLPDTYSEQQTMDALMESFMGPDTYFTLPAGMSARNALAGLLRGQIEGQVAPGTVVSDSEALDAIQYFLFPNFVPWGGYSRLNYRFRPYGNDPHSSVMDVMMLSPFNIEKPRPKAAEEQRLARGQDWGDAQGLGGLTDVFRQDMANLPRIQKGLRASRKPTVTLGNYQEIRIRHFHRELERWLAEEDQS